VVGTCGEVVKINVPGNDLQWIAQGLYLVLAHCIGEAVELNGAAGLVLGACSSADCRGGWTGLGRGSEGFKRFTAVWWRAAGLLSRWKKAASVRISIVRTQARKSCHIGLLRPGNFLNRLE
jgi:hypothetical protein